MISKLTWATAMILIVAVAGVGAWAIWGQAPALAAEDATITGRAGAGTVFAAGIPAGTASGIENVYIIAPGYTETDNLSGHGNILDVIESDTDTATISYETAFHIVVAVKVGSDNTAYVRIDNMNVGLAAYGSFTIDDENAQVPNQHANAHMAAWSHENSGYDTTSGWLRINAVWDNGGAGYTLPAGGVLNIENIRLWGWG